MRAAAFWKTVTVDCSDFLEILIALFEEYGIRYCVIGGLGVNAYVEPLVSFDLDLVISVDQLASVEALLQARFEVVRFPHSLNIAAEGSDLRVQVQTDPRYFPFVDRASLREILGVELPVAAIEDVLRGKVWAALDPARQASTRRKDLLDIERLIENYPDLRESVPAEILERLS
jgi:hypothetical protein